MKIDSYYRYLKTLQLSTIVAYGGYMLEKQDLMLKKMDKMLDKQDLTFKKMDKMIEKQDETIKEIRELRKDLKAYMDERFRKLEEEIKIIKEKLGLL